MTSEVQQTGRNRRITTSNKYSKVCTFTGIVRVRVWRTREKTNALVLQSEDLHEVADLSVLGDRFGRRVAHVEHLSTQGEHAVVVAAHDAEARHRECLGAVALRQDQRAERRVLAAWTPESSLYALKLTSLSLNLQYEITRTRVVGVVELRDAFEFGGLALRALRVHLLHRTKIDPSDHLIHDAHLRDLLHELVADFALGAELLHLQRERLLRLRVERRVLDETLDEEPQVVLHLEMTQRKYSIIRGYLDILDIRHKLSRAVRYVEYHQVIQTCAGEMRPDSFPAFFLTISSSFLHI